MNSIRSVWLYPLILAAGALQAWGPRMNSVLRKALLNPWLSSLVSFLPIVAFLVVLVLCVPRPLPTAQALGQMPWWAPLGGLIGAFAVVAGLMFVAQVGAGAFAGLTITANFVMSLIIDKYGWFGMRVHELSTGRLTGAALMGGRDRADLSVLATVTLPCHHSLMFGSLRARLSALVLLLVAASIAIGFLMLGLFRQSTVARVGQAEAELQRACDAIDDAYRFYGAGWHGSDAGADAGFRSGLVTVLQSALHQRVGVEGGIWQRDTGSLAYAYPTYEGSGPKTDLPQAELPRIGDINRVAANEDRATSTRYAASSQTLLLTACPLSGPIPHVTGWAMTRVVTFAGRAYGQLMTGLAVLLATVLAAAVLLTRLTFSWTRHIGIIRSTLAAHDLAELPTLPPTGERELDQIVFALNDAGTRLAQARKRAQVLSNQVATAERLAAIGRLTAGVAHEIRNPIAAMRLKAENAMAKGGDRYHEALAVILEQIARLDRLLRRLLNVTEPEQAELQKVDLGVFLDQCLATHGDAAEARGIRLQSHTMIAIANFDPELMRRALDNLLSNAIQAAPRHSLVELTARTDAGQLILCVSDEGAGPPESVRERLFEPFVTGRTDGTGLGLSIVREVAEAHEGSAQFRRVESSTVFEIVLPWQPS